MMNKKGRLTMGFSLTGWSYVFFLPDLGPKDFPIQKLKIGLSCDRAIGYSGLRVRVGDSFRK